MSESGRYPLISLSEVLVQDKEYITELEPRLYPKLSVKLYGRGVVLNDPADGATVRMKRHQLAKPGQIILSEIWAKKGAIGTVPEEGAGALVTSHFFLFDIDESKLLRPYIGWLLAANYFEPMLGEKARGTTGYAAIRPKQFLGCKIPLPPLDEQRRIVARIEELTALIEEARGLRAAAKQDTGKLAQAALRDTFENLCDEVKETKPFSDIVSEILNGMSKRIWVDPPEGVASLNIRNITQQDFSIASCRRILFDSERHTKYLTQLGDLLICNVNGSPRLVGAIAVFPGASEQVVIDHNITRVRLKSEIIPEFIVYHLREPTTRVAIEARFGTTAGQSYLPQRKLVTLPLSIPPLSEQRHIVAYLDDLQAQVDALTALQEATQAELDALLPAVLDRAFRGKL